MPTLQQIRTVVDNRLANLWTNQIVPRQEQYAANHDGRYWQGIVLWDVDALPNNPDNGGSSPLEVVPQMNRKPHDQATSWAAAGLNLGATIPMALAIDVYDGPDGTGYVGQVWVRWRGNTYTRAQNNGPEDWRTFGWRQVEPR